MRFKKSLVLLGIVGLLGATRELVIPDDALSPSVVDDAQLETHLQTIWPGWTVGEYDVVVLANSPSVSNTAPVAANDSFGSSWASLNVLTNDTDADSDPLTAAVSGAGPSSPGTLVLATAGTFTFAPTNPELFDTVTFQYVANDGTTNSNLATVDFLYGTDPNTPPPTVVPWLDAMPTIEALAQTTPGKGSSLNWTSTSGDREEIGLFTEWQSEYLATGAGQAELIAQADATLGFPWCDYNLMTNPIWNGGSYGYSFSHTPNAFFLPYLLTSDPKYIAPMECQFQIFQEFPYWNRGDPIPPLIAKAFDWTTGRVFAWQLRNTAQLAYLEQLGVTTHSIYIESLELTRQEALVRMSNPIEAEFHVLGENQLSGSNQWTGWMESFIGQVVNYTVDLGFSEWQSVAEWHFVHLQNRSGDRWPAKATDNDHTSPTATGATWENTPIYNALRTPCYTAADPNELMSLNLQCGGFFMTFDDRAQNARSWAAMAAENGIAGAVDLYWKIDGLIDDRGQGGEYFKYSMTTPPISGDPNDLIGTSPGQWTELPNTDFGSVLPPQSFTQPIAGIVGPGAITGAWSGGTWDSTRNQLMIFGGGHADYQGNDWPTFSTATSTWSLIHGPSDLTGYDDQSGQTPDGKPASRHTYAGLAYIEVRDRMLIYGGSLANGAGTGDDRWWTGDPATGNWVKEGGTGAFAFLGNALAHNTATGLTYSFRAGSLWRYDITSFVSISSQADNGKLHMTTTIDPTRNTLLAVGEERAYSFDLATGARTILTSVNGTAFAAVKGTGIQYVPNIDRYVAWGGDAFLYFIHPTTFAVTQKATTGVRPTFTPNGVYGRFQYSVVHDGFFIVTGIDDNVFFVKTPGVI